jgi:hypothetical protein
MKTDKQGKATGSFAVYGGSSLVRVSSLCALSANDRWLAGAPVNGAKDVTIWNVEAVLAACRSANDESHRFLSPQSAGLTK